MVSPCEAKEAVGVGVYKIRALKIEQNRDLRSQSTKTKILDFKIEGGEEGEISNTVTHA